ncbi:MAG: response regulator [Dehalococcoidia bacterium]
MRVLSVNDEIEIGKLLQRELERQGCEVEYTTSTELIELIEFPSPPKLNKLGTRYDILLLDLDIIEVSGLELLQEIREAHVGLEVIVITRDGDEDKAMEAIGLGAIDYLHKPISLDELRTALFRIQQKRAAQGRMALKHRVLVVDDEKDLAARMNQELDREGYEMAVVYDGIAGLEYFRNNHVDVVIADIRMPGMDGLEMLDKCRAINPDFVSIVLTGFGDHEKAIKSLKLGVFAYLRKPISLEELVGVVGKGVDMVALRRSLGARQRELEIESALKTRYTRRLEENITERKILEGKLKELYETEKGAREELEEEARIRDRFINILAHEMRTPLTPLLISAGMLKDALSFNHQSTQFKLSNNILNSAQATVFRLDELLDLARFSAGTFTLNLQPLDTMGFLEKEQALAKFPKHRKCHSELVSES